MSVTSKQARIFVCDICGIQVERDNFTEPGRPDDWAEVKLWRMGSASTGSLAEVAPEIKQISFIGDLCGSCAETLKKTIHEMIVPF